ncbi:MAG: ATP-binding cassette domain-containing protein [Candidatus Lokiarchaeota archaeon]|nr:ATP-binding cassette domain-containing protein [Candidatus Lokiarchaeota archaeon]
MMVKTTNLKRTFEFGDSEIHALDGVDLKVSEGEFVVILGPSGAGKTTLLNMIGGIDHPTAGSVVVDGENLEDYSMDQLHIYRKNDVGWIFQFFNIVDSLRAWENVGLALEFQGNSSKSEIKQRSYDILKKVGLEDKEMRFPSQLSGGEQQRVAIARALVKKPKIVVADEPTGNLDYVTGQKIAELMKDLNKQEKITFVVVSHDVSITRFADRIYHLKMGKIEKVQEKTDNDLDLPRSKKVTGD